MEFHVNGEVVHVSYLQNIKHNFIEQVKVHHIINSLESLRGIVIVRCSVERERIGKVLTKRWVKMHNKT